MRQGLCVLLLSATLLPACEGTKVRLVNPHPPGTPAYLYDEAFYSLRNSHGLFQRLQGAPAAQQKAALDDIVRSASTLQDLLEDPFRTELQPILEDYRRIQASLAGGGAVASGTFLEMDGIWRKVNARFYPEGVKLKREASAGTAATPPAPPSSASPPVPPAAPAATPAAPIPGWMAATAWRQSHAALVAAWPGDPAAAAAAFAKAREALAAVHAAAGVDAAPLLQIYLNEYDRLAAQTERFSKVPAGQTAEGVSKALGAVGKGVEAQLPKP